MAEFDILESVKIALGQQGNNYINSTFNSYIEEVKEYLMDGGCSKEVVDSPTSAGVIARGVADLWNYGSGTAELSPYFKERAIQLCSKKEAKSGL